MTLKKCISNWKSKWIFWLAILDRHPIGFSSWKFRMGFLTEKSRWNLTGLFGLKFHLKNSWKSQLGVQLDFPTGKSNCNRNGLSNLKFQLAFPVWNPSWKAMHIFQLEILTGISSGGCAICFPAGNSDWFLQL